MVGGLKGSCLRRTRASSCVQNDPAVTVCSPRPPPHRHTTVKGQPHHLFLALFLETLGLKQTSLSPPTTHTLRSHPRHHPSE